MERAPSRHDDIILFCCPEIHPRLTVALPAAEVPMVQNSRTDPQIGNQSANYVKEEMAQF